MAAKAGDSMASPMHSFHICVLMDITHVDLNRCGLGVGGIRRGRVNS
jgi:hypothetical protein